jgi:hypothetical protein
MHCERPYTSIDRYQDFSTRIFWLVVKNKATFMVCCTMGRATPFSLQKKKRFNILLLLELA